MSGFFITFEGIEGTGKSTQANALYKRLQKEGVPVYKTHEPGGTAIGDKIRNLLLDPDNKEMSVITETLLYEASRAQLVTQVIKPYLEEGYIVICDRFFDSTVAYQGFGRGIPVNTVREVNSLAAWGVSPNLTFYLDLEPEASFKRVKMRVQETEKIPDRLERETIDFFRKIKDGYYTLINDEPFRFKVMDGMLSPQELHSRIWEVVERELKKANLLYKSKKGVEAINLPLGFSFDSERG